MDKTRILHELLRRGYYIAKADSPRQELLDFIQLLVPIDVGIPLLRIGSDHNGGYLVPDDLDGVTTLLSPGVGGNSDFEYSLANRGIKCFLADYSVDGPAVYHSNFIFLKKFIGNKRIGRKGEYLSLDAFLNFAKIKSLELGWDEGGEFEYALQMDIEGAELEVLLDVSDQCLSKFRFIVLEMHFLERIFHAPLLILYRAIIEKLTRHFYIVHIHPNNAFPSVVRDGIDVPPLLEITLLNRNRVYSSLTRPAKLPHELDEKTVPNNKEVVLSDLYSWSNQ